MLDVELYLLYNGLCARDLMPCLCCDFCDFHQSAVFFAIFCRDFLLSLDIKLAVKEESKLTQSSFMVTALKFLTAVVYLIAVNFLTQ